MHSCAAVERRPPRDHAAPRENQFDATPARLLLVFVVNLLAAAAAGAQPVVSGFTQSTVASGLQSPTAMEGAPDGRLFVLEVAI